MHTHRVRVYFGFASLILLVVLSGLAGCTSGQAPIMQDYTVMDFNMVHSALAGKINKYLILGSLPVAQPSAKTPPELASFLGRWEGYSYDLPVKRDRKIVIVIQEINAQNGKLIYWSGTNLQYPDVVGEVHFRVVPGRVPAIEWQIFWPDGRKSTETFSFISKKNQLEGWSKYSQSDQPGGPYELSRAQNFFIYKDYPQYLAGKGIFARAYQNSQLKRYGAGFLYYLPEGYSTDAFKTWPLIVFLHGYGDRGDNIFALAKASPFMYIRDQGSLPFIIVAPLLSAKAGEAFPNDYMDGALNEIRANFRVNPKRIYVTGSGMGGESTWRFALHQPDTFAAIAPLSAYLDQIDPQAMKNIAALPVWAIHGGEDALIPLARGQQPVDALKAAGGNVRFTVMESADHDTWTDTYSNPAFYEWLLEQVRP